MKRVKRISANAYHGDVEVTVRFTNTYGLIKREVDDVVTDLADRTMAAISSTKFLNVPLSKIRVN